MATPPGPLVDATRRLEQSSSLDGLRASTLRWPVRSTPGGQRPPEVGLLGHALHLLLTDVPIGCWTAASALDLRGRPQDRGASRWLVGAGLAASAPTALTGLAEWARTGREAQRVGALHAALNAVATTLYLTSYVARARRRHGLGVAAALAGAAVTGASGYLGGHLTMARKIGSRDPAAAVSTRSGRRPGAARRANRSSRSAAPAHSRDRDRRRGRAGRARPRRPGRGSARRCPGGAPPRLPPGLRVLGGCHPDPARGRAAHPRPGPAGLLAEGPSPSDVSAYRVGTLAQDVLAVMDAAGVDSAHVVGHRQGGAVAWYLGTHHAERGRLPHRALDAAPERTGPLDDPLAATPARLVHVRRAGAGARARHGPHAGAGAPAVGTAGRPRRRYAQRLGSPSALRGPLAWYQAAARRPPWDPSWAPLTPRQVDLVNPPTTYVWGWHDPSLGRAPAEATRDRVAGDYLFVGTGAVTGCPSCIPTRWPVPSSTASSTRYGRAPRKPVSPRRDGLHELTGPRVGRCLGGSPG